MFNFHFPFSLGPPPAPARRPQTTTPRTVRREVAGPDTPPGGTPRTLTETARDLPDRQAEEADRLEEGLEVEAREELGAPVAPAPAPMAEVEAVVEAAAPVVAGVEECLAGTIGSTATPGAE